MRQADYFTKTLKILSHIMAWGLLFWLPFLLRVPARGKPGAIHANAQTGWLLLYLCASILWVTIFYINANFFIRKMIYSIKIWPYSFLHLMYISSLFFILPLLYWSFLEIKSPENYGLNFFSAVCILPYLLIFAGSTAYHFIKVNFHFAGAARYNETRIFSSKAVRRGVHVKPLHIYKSLKNISSAKQKTPDGITPSSLKLSSLADYLAHNATSLKAPLETEIEHLKNYVELLGQDITPKINVSVSAEIINGRYEIKPLQLISFVENAFIYDNGITENTEIEISLNSRKNMLRLIIKNAPYHLTGKPAEKPVEPGLVNIKRKLLVNCLQNNS